MRALDPIIFANQSFFNRDKFPYFYLSEHDVFLRETEHKRISIVLDENGNTMACKLWENKFLAFLQPMFPPLSKNGERLNREQEKAFLEELVVHAKKNNISRITQPDNFAIFKEVPRRSLFAPFGSYILNLQKHSESELLAHMHGKHRNVIMNAQKAGVEIRYGYETLRDFYVLYKQTMDRSRMFAYPEEYFSKLLHSLPDNTICGVCYFQGEPLGGLFIPFTKFRAFYTHGASSEKKLINGAITYLHWQTIRMLKQKGVQDYDFVGARLSDVSGTRLHGIQQFKERFGSALDTGFLWKKNIKKFDCLVFDLMVYMKHSFKKLRVPMDIIGEELDKETRRKRLPATELSEKVQNKWKAEKHRIGKSLRIFKKGITLNSLTNQLTRAGIQPGDTLMVHSSLSKIGNVKGGAQTVIEALIKQVGTRGNIMFPSYTYRESMQCTAEDSEFVFIPETTPSVVGIISEEFRKLPGVKRSIHPTHSVTAFGPQADFITEGHFAAETNFGPDSPFNRLKELNGKIAGLGISIGPVTIYHALEDLHPELFKGVYLPAPLPIRIQRNGETIAKKVLIHNPAYHKDRIDKNKKIEGWLYNHFLQKGILHVGAFGQSTMWWMNVNELFEELLVLRKKGITIYKTPEL